MHTRPYKRCLHPCPIHPTFIHWCSPLIVDILVRAISCAAMVRNGQPPEVATGDYFRTRGSGSSRCKAYSAPPGIGGRYICTVKQGIYLGPVGEYELTDRYLIIEVRSYWINVWDCSNHVSFAHRVHDEKLHHGSKEEGIMLRKWLPKPDVEVVVIHYTGCFSLGHPACG